jgi:hypothetical protein
MLAGWIIDSCASWTEADAPGAGQRQDRVRATDPGLTPGATGLAPARAGSVKQFPGGAEGQSFGYPSLVLTGDLGSQLRFSVARVKLLAG